MAATGRKRSATIEFEINHTPNASATMVGQRVTQMSRAFRHSSRIGANGNLQVYSFELDPYHRFRPPLLAPKVGVSH
jgi:hypothetical protein